jgi:hypothetical protein
MTDGLIRGDILGADPATVGMELTPPPPFRIIGGHKAFSPLIFPGIYPETVEFGKSSRPEIPGIFPVDRARSVTSGTQYTWGVLLKLTYYQGEHKPFL